MRRVFLQLRCKGAHGSTVGYLLDMSQSMLLTDAPQAIFVASGNGINVDGANAFITGALPLIRADVPDLSYGWRVTCVSTHWALQGCTSWGGWNRWRKATRRGRWW